MTRKVVTGLAGVAVVVAGTLSIATQLGRGISARRNTAGVDHLLDASRGAPAGIVTDQELDPLPEPVRRWLRWAGVVGRERVSIVRLEQRGEFRMGPDQRWMPFIAVQHYTTNPPGFIWSVSMEMFPLVSITGWDRYQDGQGSIEMRLLSLIPVASKRGDGLNQGAMLRYLNELMWFPTAALSPEITWEAIDDGSARATFTDAGTSVSADFVFDAEGQITTMTADRFNDARGKLLPWSTPITGYGEFAGFRVPTAGSGVWHYESGDFPYIRLEITKIAYDP
jgi:hypothetical protein